MLLILSLVGVALSAGGAGARDPSSAEQKQRRSQARAAASTVSYARPGQQFEPAQARGASAALSDQVPLPEGGSFNGIRWEEVEGVLTEADLVHVLEFNAACQWLRASRDGRETEVARAILEEIPSWASFRENERGELFRDVLAQLDQRGPVARAVLDECDSSHQSEVGYAIQRGTAPSR